MNLEHDEAESTFPRAFLVLTVCVLLVAAGRSDRSVRAAEPKKKAVDIIVVHDKGKRKECRDIPWTKTLTVLDAMKIASKRPNGLSLKYKGRGATAFVTAIDGVANEGGGKKKKNWLFWVNGKLSIRGVGAQVLKPGDVVLWKFEVFPAGTNRRNGRE